jgi:hypothetical protein
MTEFRDNEFHWTDGWFFRRVDDGDVEIRKHTDGRDTVVRVPRYQWCSIITHVSAAPNDYHAAEALHIG